MTVEMPKQSEILKSLGLLTGNVFGGCLLMRSRTRLHWKSVGERKCGPGLGWTDPDCYETVAETSQVQRRNTR